jgi:DNA polymerase III gamma/tau subunit
MSDDLIIKYRPTAFKQMIGQDKAVSSFANVLKAATSRSWMFIGPAGTGKTTLARIAASKVGVDARNIIEVNAADNTGVDSMRDVMESARYVGLGGGKKLIIIDECQRLSGAAWDSMLKMVEEPPTHLHWAFCTTEPTKIPATIKTRCTSFELSPVAKDVLFDFLKTIVAAEQFTTPDDVLTLLAERAFGSPRQALAFLAQTFQCQSRREAAEIIKSASEEGTEIQLCQALIRGIGTWDQVLPLLEPLREMNGEGVRLTIVNYMTKVLMTTKGDEKAAKGLTILEAFSTPYPSGAGIYPVMLSLGKILYQPA